MLQILLEPSDNYTLPEQAQMAIEGGCTWLIISADNMSDAEIRELAREAVPMCRDAGVILTITGHPELAAELGLHGMLLHAADKPALIRQQLGPEAIIGAISASPERILEYDKADIDYICLTDRRGAETIAAVRAAGSLIPFVAMGDYRIEDVPMLRFEGFNGVCTGKYVFEAQDPVACIRRFLAAFAD